MQAPVPMVNETGDLLIANMLPTSMLQVEALLLHHHKGLVHHTTTNTLGQNQITLSSLVMQASTTASMVFVHFIQDENIAITILQYACELPAIGLAAGSMYRFGRVADLICTTTGRIYANCGPITRAAHHGGEIPQSLYQHLQDSPQRSVSKWVVFSSHRVRGPRLYRVAVLTNTHRVWIFGGIRLPNFMPSNDIERPGLYDDIFLGTKIINCRDEILGIYLVKKPTGNKQKPPPHIFVPLNTTRSEERNKRNFMLFGKGG